MTSRWQGSWYLDENWHGGSFGCADKQFWRIFQFSQKLPILQGLKVGKLWYGYFTLAQLGASSAAMQALHEALNKTSQFQANCGGILKELWLHSISD
jgi:hypothetical protein